MPEVVAGISFEMDSFGAASGPGSALVPPPFCKDIRVISNIYRLLHVEDFSLAIREYNKQLYIIERTK